MLQTAKRHPIAITIYLLLFVPFIFIFDFNIAIWIYIIKNFLAFYLVNFLTCKYNAISKTSIRPITFQIKIGFIVILIFVIYNCFQLYLFGEPSGLAYTSLDIIIPQNIILYFLFHPISTLFLITFSIMFDGTLWTPIYSERGNSKEGTGVST